ncbi:MAG: hypothetical protein L3J45_06975 [Flavobacteriaceae bacterium]|nr:hypothetical protein [Flavobacteriaceae bacterium]
MNALILKYLTTKSKAQQFMNNGQITDYINTLVELNQQKRLLKLAIAN